MNKHTIGVTFLLLCLPNRLSQAINIATPQWSTTVHNRDAAVLPLFPGSRNIIPQHF